MSTDLPRELEERTRTLGPSQREEIQRLAHALWEEAGRPQGRALDYWLRAEQEIVNQSSAGEEDPLAALDSFEPGVLGGRARG
jgi:hypothetical protein